MPFTLAMGRVTFDNVVLAVAGVLLLALGTVVAVDMLEAVMRATFWPRTIIAESPRFPVWFVGGLVIARSFFSGAISGRAVRAITKVLLAVFGIIFLGWTMSVLWILLVGAVFGLLFVAAFVALCALIVFD